MIRNAAQNSWTHFSINTGRKTPYQSAANQNVGGIDRKRIDAIALERQLAKQMKEVWDD